MTISIQLQTADDLKLMEPLLQLLRQFEVNVKITSGSSISRQKKSARSKRPEAGIVERLHGVVQIPDGFDYKTALTTELLNKYGVHG